MTSLLTPRSTPTELTTLLNRRSVATNCTCADAADALRKSAALLVRVGAASDEYADAAISRERDYPTGLRIEPAGVALPHADTGVLRPAIALLTLRQAVLFGEMGSGQATVPVRLVVMLAFPPGDAHVQAIGALAEIIQQPAFVAEALRAATPNALYSVFQRWTALSGRKE